MYVELQGWVLDKYQKAKIQCATKVAKFQPVSLAEELAEKGRIRFS